MNLRTLHLCRLPAGHAPLLARSSAFAMGVPRVTSLEKVQEGCHYSGSAPDLTKALRTPAEVRPLLFTASLICLCSGIMQPSEAESDFVSTFQPYQGAAHARRGARSCLNYQFIFIPMVSRSLCNPADLFLKQPCCPATHC